MSSALSSAPCSRDRHTLVFPPRPDVFTPEALTTRSQAFPGAASSRPQPLAPPILDTVGEEVVTVLPTLPPPPASAFPAAS